MPRPITKKDIKRWRTHLHFRKSNHSLLGVYITHRYSDGFAYATRISDGWPHWVSKKTLEKRKRTGHPIKKFKAKMREPDFGLEEMALAEAIINGG